MNPVAPWTPGRSVRNRNPGNLRPRVLHPPWPQQSATDIGPSGAYAVFASDADGWCALGLWCLEARYLRGLKTAQQMIAVFAPPGDNNPTSAYAAQVAHTVGAGELDLTNQATLLQLMRAIANWEDNRAHWDEVELLRGLSLCTKRWPEYHAARIGPARLVRTAPNAPDPAPGTMRGAAVPGETDRLNEAELQRVRQRAAARVQQAQADQPQTDGGKGKPA